MRHLILFVHIGLCALPAAVQAAGIPAVNESRVDIGVLAGAQGRIAINEAAGTANQQVNAAAISRSAPGMAQAKVTLPQLQEMDAGAADQENVVGIGAHALAGASGILSINQASGSANRLGNVVIIALGAATELQSDAVLAGVIAGTPHLHQAGPSQEHHQMPGIDPTAFENARGIVQLNQTGGNGNVASNHFVLRITGGPAY